MKSRQRKQFLQYLLAYCWLGSERLDQLAISAAESSGEIFGDLKDRFIDCFSDPESRDYQLLEKEIIAMCHDNSDFVVIGYTQEVDGLYLYRVAADSLGLYSKTISKIESFERGQNKGIAFENFCIAFLNDIGITASSTKASNDKGVDIVGKYQTKLKESIASVIRYDYVYVLAQAKYFAEKIDTPVIRKLVGDSLFIRFDDLEYIEVKHNALHLMVFSRSSFTEPAIGFAKRNKIELFDTDRIAHIITNHPNTSWICLQ